MKCNNVMTFLSQLRAKSVSASISDDNLKYLVDSGYVERLSKDDYEKLSASLANLSTVQNEDEGAHAKEVADEETLSHDQKRTHSIRFFFEGRDKKEADRERVQVDEQNVSKDGETVHEKDEELQSLIQKKSILDKQVPFGECCLSLTGKGVTVLHDLTDRIYRVGDKEFEEFIQETKATETALQSIVEKASSFYREIRFATANMDTSPLASRNVDDEDYDEDEDEDYDEDSYRIKSKGVESSQLWSVSIGLAKLEGNYDEIKESFLQTVNMLQRFNSNLDSKLMAAETLVASGHASYPQLLGTLTSIESQVRQNGHVPEELSIGIATTLYCGINPDGLKRFDVFTRVTKSYMAAALLSSSQEAEDTLKQRFENFKSILDGWGYSPSEDTDLAATYLTLSRLDEKNAEDKMNVLVNALKSEFEFPLVPAAILTTMPLNANELLDLAEKGATILQSQLLATGLPHSELANLAIRLIYGH